jgi:hypothetical protein
MNQSLSNDLKNYYQNQELMLEDETNIKSIVVEKNNALYSKIRFKNGSVPYESLIKTLNYVKQPKRFVVIGAGVGTTCFHWNSLYPNIPTIGIDLHSKRINYGQELIRKYSLKNIELKIQDFGDFQFQDEDLVFEHNTCYDVRFCHYTNLNALKNYNIIGIITFKHVCNIPEKYESILENVATEWSKNEPIFIYRPRL